MARGWNQGTLFDLVALQRGFDITKAQQVEGPYPVVSSSGVTSYHAEFRAEGPGVVLGRKGSLGTVFYVEQSYWPHDTTLWVTDFKGNSPRFAYYFLKTLGLEQYDVGAANPSLNRNHIHGIPIAIPTRKMQDHIANVLSAYDDLIENNTNRIKILEEMARSLYREWFVEFRFPGHENATFVQSAIGRVPKGWAVAPLQALTSKIGSGATPRGGKESYKSEGLSLIRSMNVFDYRFEPNGLAHIDDAQAAELDNVVVEPHDVLLNITGVSVARCCLAPKHVIPARVNQHVAIIRVDRERANPIYVLETLNSHSFKGLLLAMAQGGATRDALTKEGLCRFTIPLPPVKLLRAYENRAEPLIEHAEQLRRVNEVLRRTRDLLLPRLISGEIELPA